MHKTILAEIILCTECKGNGKVSERISLHESKSTICLTCDGRRVLKKVTEVRFETVEPVEGKES